MDISQYLIELIKTRKEVGLAGMGTFFKKKFPGRYDAESHSFLPPSYVIAFTADILEDSLLRDFISKQRNISADSADYFTSQFVENVLKQLEEHREAIIEGLGKLIQQPYGISFEPENKQNFGFDFYGLPPVKDLEPLKIAESVNIEEIIEPEGILYTPADETENQVSADEKEESKKTEEDEPVYDEIADLAFSAGEKTPPAETTLPFIEDSESDSSLSENAESAAFNNMAFKEQQKTVQNPKSFYHEEPNYAEEKSKGMPLYLKILIGILLVLVAGVLAYLIKPEFFNSLIKDKLNHETDLPLTEKENLKNTADSLSFADSIMQNAKKAGLEVDSARDTLKVITEQKTLSETTYEVIGASVLNDKEAADFIGTMKTRGIAARIVAKKPGKRIKISIATLNTPEAAEKERETLEKELNIKGLYIYINKPDLK